MIKCRFFRNNVFLQDNWSVCEPLEYLIPMSDIQKA